MRRKKTYDIIYRIECRLRCMPGNKDKPIAVHELVLAYGDHRVLDGFSLNVPAHSITALLGRTGAGKSATLSALLRIARDDAGQTAVCSIDPGADALLIFSITSCCTIIDGLAAAGLKGWAWDQRPGSFAKGNRQKIANAVALLCEVPMTLPALCLPPRAWVLRLPRARSLCALYIPTTPRR